MPGAPNPEAIAWYLAKSEKLMGELRDEVQSLRTRAGQLAGFSGAVLALAGANSESVLSSLQGPGELLVRALHARARAVARSRAAIHGSLRSIESMTRQIDTAVRLVRKAEYFFFAGLFTVGAAFASLIVVISF